MKKYYCEKLYHLLLKLFFDKNTNKALYKQYDVQYIIILTSLR